MLVMLIPPFLVLEPVKMVHHLSKGRPVFGRPAPQMPAGPRELWVRAVDALGRSQPLDGSIHWNPSGYEWNGVEKIAVRVG